MYTKRLATLGDSRGRKGTEKESTRTETARDCSTTVAAKSGSREWTESECAQATKTTQLHN